MMDGQRATFGFGLAVADLRGPQPVPGGVVSVAALLLSDSRFPAGGHAHSGGVEAAVTAGTVSDLASLEAFLRGRLRTAGLVAAGLAAAACARAGRGGRGGRGGAETAAGGERRPVEGTKGREGEDHWVKRHEGAELLDLLDAEADARAPSPAQRAASRRQGRALLRAARVAWPEDPGLAGLAASGAATARAPGRASVAVAGGGVAGGGVAGGGVSGEYRRGPHHAVVLGAAAAAAGCGAGDAARIAAYQSVAGAASAAVRLLALDPMLATAVLARLTVDVDQIAERAAAAADGPLEELPCPSAPALDLLAEAHVRAEVRLFES
jgi:urease accessory protein